MADLGDLLGSLMSGLIRARRMADEQTASLAEYYKDNPLLEGLSVPRIRIPELTIDMPLLIEDYSEGESGEMKDPTEIATAAESRAKEALSKNNIKVSSNFYKMFVTEVKNQLALIKQSGTSIMKESISRSVQGAFADTLAKTETILTASQKETIAKNLKTTISTINLAKKPVAPNIMANIKTADVKERASGANVVRMKITLKEEGLEWTTQMNESGSVVSTLQPE
jgi:hypothetical protein